MAKDDILPPLKVMENWRKDGLSPKEIRQKCMEWVKVQRGIIQKIRRIKRDGYTSRTN